METYRFSRDVNAVAPKPGHHLGTIAFNHEGESYLLWMIEGPDNDTLNFRGMATNFDETRLFRFGVRGPALEVVNELPYDPSDRRLAFDLDTTGDDVGLRSAQAIYSTVRSPNGLHPDAALMRMTTASGATIDTTVAELRRGWSPTLVLLGATVAVGACLAGQRFGQRYLKVRHREEKMTVEGAYEVIPSIAADTARVEAEPLQKSTGARLLAEPQERAVSLNEELSVAHA